MTEIARDYGTAYGFWRVADDRPGANERMSSREHENRMATQVITQTVVCRS